MPETIEALLVLLVAVLPGALHIWATEREAGRWGIGLSDRLVRFVGATAIYQAIFAYPVYLVWTNFLHKPVRSNDGTISFINRVELGTAPGWLWFLPLLYIAVPLAVGTLAGVSIHRWPRLSRVLVGRDPAPTAWEFLFSARPEGVVRARLKADGRWIGGLYGPDSYAAGYPEKTMDLYLERTYRLAEDGTFAEGDAPGGYQELGPGLLIRWDEIAEMEFFHSGREA